MARLTAAKVRTAAPGRYSDGGTLTLLVTERGGRSWVQRMTIAGKRVDIGLGPVSVVTLSMARERALENRRRLWAGEDPRTGRPAPLAPVAAPVSTAPTFREAAAAVLETNKASWRNPRSAALWVRMLERHAYPAIGDKRVDAIGRAAALAVLAPVMRDAPPTGRKLRQAVRQVLAWAQAHGHIDQNPAGEMIAAALPKARASKPRKAAPYREVGAMLRTVEASTMAEASKACFVFTVLTGVRPGEARGARWSEIDTDAGTWTVPGERMKKGQPHRVPLSRESLAVLERAAALVDGSDLVFPSPANRGRELSHSTLVMALRRLGITVDVHGFRSSVRDWCAEQTDTPREVCEAVLAHVNGDATERAYFRSDLFDKRRAVMAAWAAFVLAGV